MGARRVENGNADGGQYLYGFLRRFPHCYVWQLLDANFEQATHNPLVPCSTHGRPTIISFKIKELQVIFCDSLLFFAFHFPM